MATASIDLLADYREAAAARFASWKSALSVSAPPPGAEANPDVECYQRELFPELRKYLSAAANKFRSSQRRPLHATKRSVRRRAQVLGHGELAAALAPTPRKQRWLVARAAELHRIRAHVREIRPVMDAVAPCGIPDDVRVNAHERFLKCKMVERRRQLGEGRVVEKRLGCLDAAAEDCRHVFASGIRVDPRGFVQHIERCRQALVKAEVRLFPRGGKMQIPVLDTFEEVRKIYAGRPDELYRRKAARRYATWRRKRNQREQEMLEKVLCAENEMKRRRGHDHLLTGRKPGDMSCAPFRFELDSNAYAFSSKITKAPRLRKAMIEKYSTVSEESESSLNSWERAQHVAETNPLFHTRVMNRFT